MIGNIRYSNMTGNRIATTVPEDIKKGGVTYKVSPPSLGEALNLILLAQGGVFKVHENVLRPARKVVRDTPSGAIKKFFLGV